jgi:hypothetical protein
MKKSNTITRRTTLAALTGAGAAAFFIPAWNETIEAADGLACVPSTPAVTEGPYWVDEKLFVPISGPIPPPPSPVPAFLSP